MRGAASLSTWERQSRRGSLVSASYPIEGCRCSCTGSLEASARQASRLWTRAFQSTLASQAKVKVVATLAAIWLHARSQASMRRSGRCRRAQSSTEFCSLLLHYSCLCSGCESLMGTPNFGVLARAVRPCAWRLAGGTGESSGASAICSSICDATETTGRESFDV